MKQGGQKKKSSVHELEVGKVFTEAYYPSGDGIFRRTSYLQAAAWELSLWPGDLVPLKYVTTSQEIAIDKSFPFLVECKNWRRTNVTHIFSSLYAKKSVIYDWMDQAINDAVGTALVPLVVFKLYRKNCVMLQLSEFHRLANWFGKFPGEYFQIARQSLTDISENVFIALLKDFVDWIDWTYYKLSREVRQLKSIVSAEDKK